MTYLAETDLDLALAPLQAAACTYRIALGPRAGQKVLSLQTVPSQEVPPTEQRCVGAQGFSLHAEVCCAAHQRKKLEHLCRYITRPAIAKVCLLGILLMRPDLWLSVDTISTPLFYCKKEAILFLAIRSYTAATIKLVLVNSKDNNLL
jgi:Putative transposase